MKALPKFFSVTSTCLAIHTATLCAEPTVKSLEVNADAIATFELTASSQVFAVLRSTNLSDWSEIYYGFPSPEATNRLRLGVGNTFAEPPKATFFQFEDAAPSDADVALLAQWEIWQNDQRADYWLVVKQAAQRFQSGLILLNVQNGQIAHGEVLRTAQWLTPSEYIKFPTVPDLFSRARAVLTGNAPYKEVTYHSEFGFPTFIYAGDFVYDASVAADIDGIPIQLVDEEPANPAEDPITIESARLKRDLLILNGQYEYCGKSALSLTTEFTTIRESNPPQLDVFLRHERSSMECTQSFDDGILFDLAPLRDRMADSNNPIETLSIQIHTVVDGETEHVATVLYEPFQYTTQM